MTISRVSTLSLALAVAVFALGYAGPAFAPPPNCPGDHPSCKDDSGSGGDGDIYTVLISGDIGGGTDAESPWIRSGGKKSIGGPAPDSGFLTNLNPFFESVFGTDDATTCFGVGDFVIRGGGLGTGKKDVAKAQFWFDAKTFEGIPPESELITLTYQLQYLGTFSEPNWLPGPGETSYLIMDEWRLTATNEGEDIKAISCIGEGLTSSPSGVMIAVENVTGP